MTETDDKGAQPLGSGDLMPITKYAHTCNVDKTFVFSTLHSFEDNCLTTKECPEGETESIVSNEHRYAEATFDTLTCHTCNIDVPLLFFKEHNASEKHVTLKNIFQKVLERVSKQLSTDVIYNENGINKDMYFCKPCSKIIKIVNKDEHDKSDCHIKSLTDICIVNEFYNNILKENVSKEVRDVENEKVLNDESKKLTMDTDKNDEKETPSLSNKHKSLTSDEHFESNEEFSSEEEYLKAMIKKYKLEGAMPVVDGEFICIVNPSGIKVKVSMKHFHSYLTIVNGIRVYCQICNKKVECKEESKHKVSEKHARNLLIPIKEQFARTINVYSSHCLICNKVVASHALPEHAQNENHVKILNSSKIIETSGDIETNTHSEKYAENKIMCIDKKQYFCEVCKIYLAENELDDHINSSIHKVKIEQEKSDQKVVYCKLCNETVPENQIECHNGSKPHWTKVIEKICIDVSEGLQAYFSHDNPKSDEHNTASTSLAKVNNNVSEKQNDAIRDDNVASTTVTKPVNDLSVKQHDAIKTNNIASPTLANAENDVSIKREPEVKDNNVASTTVAKPDNDLSVKQKDAINDDNVAITTVTINEIQPFLFTFGESNDKPYTCIICDVDIESSLLKYHESTSQHDLALRKLLAYHSIKKTKGRFFCECCCQVNVADVLNHIKTEKHTALLQLEFEIDTQLMGVYIYKKNLRNSEAIMHRELYKMLLETNRIYLLANSNFYCTFCEFEMPKESEIDHALSVKHEKWIKLLFKSRFGDIEHCELKPPAFSKISL